MNYILIFTVIFQTYSFASSPSPAIQQYRVDPDECLIKGRLITTDSAPPTYFIEVKKVLEKGFGFSQNIHRGDILDIRKFTYTAATENGKLKDSTSVIFAIQYVPSLKGGYYQVNSIIE